MNGQINELPIPPDLYREILGGLDLQMICLDECTSSCDRTQDGDGHIEVSIGMSTGDEEAESTYTAFAKYDLKGMRQGREVLRITATFRVVFAISQKLPKGFSEVYKQINLHLTVIPYLRELTSSLSSRMEMSTLMMPYFFPDKIVTGNEAISESPNVTKSNKKKTRPKRE